MDCAFLQPNSRTVEEYDASFHSTEGDSNTQQSDKKDEKAPVSPHMLTARNKDRHGDEDETLNGEHGEQYAGHVSYMAGTGTGPALGRGEGSLKTANISQGFFSKYFNDVGRSIHNDENVLFNAIQGATKQFNENPIAAAGLGALGAGGTAAAVAGIKDLIRPKRRRHAELESTTDKMKDSGKKWALRGFAGAGLASLAHQYLKKESSSNLQKNAFFSQSAAEDKEIVKNKLARDTALTFQEKSTLSRKVDQLSSSEASNLRDIVSSLIGGGIGVAVAKFLMGAGFTGQTLAAIAGVALGNSLFGSSGPPTTADGNARFGANTDRYGRPRIF